MRFQFIPIDPTRARGWLGLLSLMAVAMPAWAQEHSVNPGINQHYQDPDYQHWLGTFERAGREVYDQRHFIVEQLNLKPGMQVADVGTGTGFFTLLMADAVGVEGRVFAVDIAAQFVDNVVARSRANGLGNVVGVVSTPRSAALAPQSVDVVFLCDTYHHFEYPQSMNASLFSALKSGGALYVIDYRKQAGLSSAWVMSHVRPDQAKVTQELTAAGFRFDRELPGMQQNFFLRFAKP